MKICAIQPPYAYESDRRRETIDFIISQMDACDDSFDLILTPEFSNIPGTKPDSVTLAEIIANDTPTLVEAAERTAKRCKAIVALSFMSEFAPGVYRNTTRVYDRNGRTAGEYYKQHLTNGEKFAWKLDYSYARAFHEPEIVEFEGLKLGFLICYDTYFNEYVANLSRRQPDIVLISSFQRGERQDVLRLQCQNIALQCNAYVLRASYSMGADVSVGGTSLVASPEGELLADFHNAVGRLIFDIDDPMHKYMRTNTFNGPMIRHDKFVEQGRTPMSARSCGPMVMEGELACPYPRICAHRGFKFAAPENTMPAFGMAVAYGMQEIEFDVRFSADGVPVACHDRQLGHYSDVNGNVEELTWAEIAKADCGSKFNPVFAGTRLPLFEDILKRFSRQVIFNMHIKAFEGSTPSDEKEFRRQFALLVELLYKYDCQEHVYIMASAPVQKVAIEMAPEIPRCMSADGGLWDIVDRAIEYKCQKVQLYMEGINQQMIDKAHANNILCNYFYCDDPVKAVEYFRMGVDCLLTNNCLGVYNEVHKAGIL